MLKGLTVAVAVVVWDGMGCVWCIWLGYLGEVEMSINQYCSCITNRNGKGRAVVNGGMGSGWR